MSVKSERIFPTTTSGAIRSCPLCGTGDNSLVIVEAGIEHRFGMPVLPVSDYGQALCENCGLLYVNATIDDNYLLELYSQENVAWQQQYIGEHAAWNGGTNEEELERFSSIVEMAAKFRDVRGLRWLDFGCQTGELGKIAQERYSARMFGVEVSEDYATRASKLWGSDTVRSSISSFLSEGETFDVISALETLEHIASPWETVGELRQALAADGLLVVTVPSAQYFRLKYHVFRAFRSVFSRGSLSERQGRTGRSLFGLCHTHPYNFSPASISLLLARGGFSTIYVGGSGWSKRFWYLDLMGRLISFVSRGRVQIFPSVVAIARIGDRAGGSY